MTQQEIEDIILLSLYEDKGQGYLDFRKILFLNGIEKPHEELVDLSNDLKQRELIVAANTKDGAAGRIVTNGRRHVETTLIPVYGKLSFGFDDAQKILFELGFTKDNFTNTGDLKEGPLTVAVDFEFKGKKAFFEWFRNPLTLRIHSYPQAEGSDVVSLTRIRSVFKKWAEAIYREKPKPRQDRVSLHALSTSPSDSELVSLGFANQGLIGYVEVEPSSGTRLIHQYKSELHPDKFFYTFDPKGEHLQENRLIPKNENQKWYIKSTESKDTRPLQRFFREIPGHTGDHFYCTSPSVGSLTFLGYKEERGLGHVLIEQGEGRFPLYVYSNNPNSFLFHPLDVIKYYLVSDYVREGDKKNDFIDKGVWENRYDDKYASEVNGIRTGDILFLKSAPAGGGVSLKAVGVVYGNPRNGQNLLVQWHLTLDPEVEVEVFASLETEIEFLKPDDREAIIDAVGRDRFLAIFYPRDTDSDKGNTKKPFNENTSLQGDGPTSDDKLQREPFVDALKNYILNYWDETGAKDSYTIHLDGEWGSGKSSILDMLETKLSDENWVVVRYNAWQNQHLDPPWWILLNRTFKTLKRVSRFFSKPWFQLRIYNIFWSWIKPNRWSLLSVAAIIISSVLFINLDILSHLFPTLDGIKDRTELMITLVSFAGSLYLIIKSFFGTILPGVKRDEQLLTAKDPMNDVKSHFTSIIDKANKDVVLMIDDLDRCDVKSTIVLLEGIQTLLKDRKVLYIIAGDGRWISKCFECHYSSFQELARPGYSLGHLFLAKVFQMSVSVPKMSPEAKTHYLRHLLKLKAGDIKVTEEKTSVEKQKIENATTEKQLSDILVANKEQSDINLQELRASASKKLSEIDLEEDLGHILLNYEKDFDPNARNMKRFINNYALHRNALFLSGQTLEDISPEDLIRWLFIESKWPTYAYELKDAPEKVEQIKNSNSAFKVFTDGWLEPELIQKLQ